MEHRWGRRIPTHVDVRLFGHPASLGLGCLRDVSASGAFIATQLALSPLTALRVTVPGHSRHADRVVRALVVRRCPEGIGVEWIDAASEVVSDLMRDATHHLKTRASNANPSAKSAGALGRQAP